MSAYPRWISSQQSVYPQWIRGIREIVLVPVKIVVKFALRVSKKIGVKLER